MNYEMAIKIAKEITKGKLTSELFELANKVCTSKKFFNSKSSLVEYLDKYFNKDGIINFLLNSDIARNGQEDKICCNLDANGNPTYAWIADENIENLDWLGVLSNTIQEDIIDFFHKNPQITAASLLNDGNGLSAIAERELNKLDAEKLSTLGNKICKGHKFFTSKKDFFDYIETLPKSDAIELLLNSEIQYNPKYDRIVCTLDENGKPHHVLIQSLDEYDESEWLAYVKYWVKPELIKTYQKTLTDKVLLLITH